jgi:hypothetical protein
MRDILIPNSGGMMLQITVRKIYMHISKEIW